MATLLTGGELDAAIASLDGWSGDATGLRRTVELPGFPQAIAVVDRVAVVAEEMDHHPDMDIRWNTLTFSCVTHAMGGVTERDVRLARQINEIVAAAQ
ncbi:MAG: 4a-hydroxytetrahydrobiopterin dehydratase [Mycobacterium sp.]|nr:4a-hydroxytetrahydrobiopterin dehydratase [Mycobacterium sp.]